LACSTRSARSRSPTHFLPSCWRCRCVERPPQRRAARPLQRRSASCPPNPALTLNLPPPPDPPRTPRPTPHRQDTIHEPPASTATMRKAVTASLVTTFVFYVGVGVAGYAALGDATPGNILTGFASPPALVTAANAMVLVHMVGGGRRGGLDWGPTPASGEPDPRLPRHEHNSLRPHPATPHPDPTPHPPRKPHPHPTPAPLHAPDPRLPGVLPAGVPHGRDRPRGARQGLPWRRRVARAPRAAVGLRDRDHRRRVRDALLLGWVGWWVGRDPGPRGRQPPALPCLDSGVCPLAPPPPPSA
jgi:hypothetical protein